MRRISLSIAAVFSLLTGSANAQIPPNLFPPPGTVLVTQLAAEGVQIYVCALVGSVYQWAFVAPEASLGDGQGRMIGRHFAGPTWELNDGSRTTGRVIQSAPSPRPGAIPWLLLEATSAPQGLLAGVRFIQRINTVGGVGPVGACGTPNQQVRIPYTADYPF
jgi:hypothetical protein